jgi:calcineurin-like phosphoesterase family protein
MKMTWLTADEHYYHSNILMFKEERSRRAFKTVDHMNREMIRRHNEVVSDGDTVYHLGDFTFSKNWQEARTLLGKLKGNHILILGNHDMFRAWEFIDIGFKSVHTSLKVGTFNLVHDPAIAGVLTDQLFVHGHTHALSKFLGDNSYCVSVELHDYYPVNFYQMRDEFFKHRGVEDTDFQNWNIHDQHGKPCDFSKEEEV